MMRWHRLFTDLEDQLESEVDAEREDMAREEERFRVSRLSLGDRLNSLTTSPPTSRSAEAPSVTISREVHRVVLGIHDVWLTVRIVRTGLNWVLAEIDEPQRFRGTALIPLASVNQIQLANPDEVSLSLRESDSGAPVRLTAARHVTLAFVLRDLCRRRRRVAIVTGEHVVSGTLERVGLDHCDIAVHPEEAYRNDHRFSEVRIVSLRHLSFVLVLS